MALKVVQYLALVFTALTLVPSGAHLFALPNKIALGQEAYFTVQGIYAGWALFGVIFFAALVANASLSVMLRQETLPFVFGLAATLLIAASLAVFFTWTYPANQATANWTIAPAGWEELKLQWEWSHAANAVLLFAAFACTTLSVLAKR